MATRCNDNASKEESLESRTAFEFSTAASTFLGSEREAALRDALCEYEKAYGFSNHARIRVIAGEEHASSVRLPGGGRIMTDARSAPGQMELIPSSLASADAARIRNVALHEATHASAPSQPTTFAAPLILGDGSEAIGIHGLALLVRMKDRTETAFVGMDEGACEALAAAVGRGTYSVSDPKYFAFGRLTQSLLRERSISLKELHRWVETNDLWAFVNRVLNRECHGRMVRDLETVMAAYQRARNGEPPDALVRELTGAK